MGALILGDLTLLLSGSHPIAVFGACLFLGLHWGVLQVGVSCCIKSKGLVWCFDFLGSKPWLLLGVGCGVWDADWGSLTAGCLLSAVVTLSMIPPPDANLRMYACWV
jgi:hypothetical protein